MLLHIGRASGHVNEYDERTCESHSSYHWRSSSRCFIMLLSISYPIHVHARSAYQFITVALRPKPFFLFFCQIYYYSYSLGLLIGELCAKWAEEDTMWPVVNRRQN